MSNSQQNQLFKSKIPKCRLETGLGQQRGFVHVQNPKMSFGNRSGLTTEVFFVLWAHGPWGPQGPGAYLSTSTSTSTNTSTSTSTSTSTNTSTSTSTNTSTSTKYQVQVQVQVQSLDCVTKLRLCNKAQTL